MGEHRAAPARPESRRPRSRFLTQAAVASGLALGIDLPAARAAPGPSCSESVQEIVNTALTAERLTVTLYYTGLTSAAILADPRLAGPAGDLAAARTGDNAANASYLQAALIQEQQHAQLLVGAGATSPYNTFYFPDGTFEHLGRTDSVDTFLWVIDHLETACIGAYLAAIMRLGALGRTDLALLAARIMGVECEHRALCRMISQDAPADNVTLEVASYTCTGDATRTLEPFLTGQGLPGGASHAVRLPALAQIAAVVRRPGAGSAVGWWSRGRHLAIRRQQ